MQVLIVRHAPAEDHDEFVQRSGQPDELRPLSDKGRHKMLKIVQGLQLLIPKMEAIASSPLLRAQQTADIIAQAYPHVHRDTLPALAPLGSLTEILSYLQDHAHTSHLITLVGHEPYSGRLATWLLTAQTDDWLPLKKGAACLLECEGQVQPGYAVLNWALTPGQLRQLNKNSE